MPKYTVTDPQTGQKVTLTGGSPPTEQELNEIFSAIPAAPSHAPSNAHQVNDAQPESVLGAAGKNIKNEALGLLRGAAGIGNTLLAAGDKIDEWLGTAPRRSLEDLVTGKKPKTPYEQRAEGIDQGLIAMGADPDSYFFKGGKIAGELAGTAGTGPLIGGAVKAIPLAAPLGEAIATSGMSSGALKGVAGGATKVAGGATSGGAQLGMIDPDSAGVGAAIGGALPGVFGAGAKVGDVAADMLRPLFESGQKTISARQLFQMAADPEKSLQALKSYNEAGQQLVPGSVPTVAAITGDTGLAGLQRALKNQASEHGGFSAALTGLETAQNTARTKYLEEIAGNPGKIETAKDTRDLVTSDLRERALDAAGDIPALPILDHLDAALKNPNNANRRVQAAINMVRDDVARWTDDYGNINSRALYNGPRKLINDLVDGKISTDNSNILHAIKEITGFKPLIDDAIENAIKANRSRAPGQAGAQFETAQDIGGMPAVRPGREVGPAANRNAIAGYEAPNTMPAVRGPFERYTTSGQMPTTMSGAREFSPGAEAEALPSWKEYLNQYVEHSKPINQMELLEDILRRSQRNTKDDNGNFIISQDKINGILKNEMPELKKVLTDEQLQRLRNVAADIEAANKGNTSGISVGSNTAQNLSAQNLLSNLLGSKIGGSMPVRTTAGALLKIPYSAANKEIQNKLNDLVLDPVQAQKALEKILQSQTPLSDLLNPALLTTYRAAPVLPEVRR